MWGTGTASQTPSMSFSGEATGMHRSASADRRQDEREEREMFSKLEKPRVRYDVEVVTKLIVYAGMASPRKISLEIVHQTEAGKVADAVE